MPRPSSARNLLSAALFCAAACAQAADVYLCPQRGAPLYTTEPAAPCLNRAELPAISSYSSGGYKLDTPPKAKSNKTKTAKHQKNLLPEQEQTGEAATQTVKRQKHRRRPNLRSAK